MLPSPPPAPPRDPAARRFFVLQAARLTGVALVVLGIIASKGTALLFIGEDLGYAMMGLGLLILFFVPVWLARKWRSEQFGRDTQTD